MNIFFKLLRNPIIKIAGVTIILYFGLFADKKNPQSLGYRLSAAQLKKNLSEVQEKSVFIASNLRAAKSAKSALNEDVATQNSEINQQNLDKITTKDLDYGEGEDVVKCGYEIEISYTINVQRSGSQLESIENEKLIIGENKNSLLEKKIVGMKRGGVRIINVPRDFQTINKKLGFLLKFNETDLNYRIVLHSLKPFLQLNCG